MGRLNIIEGFEERVFARANNESKNMIKISQSETEAQLSALRTQINDLKTIVDAMQKMLSPPSDAYDEEDEEDVEEDVALEAV